MKHLKQLTLLLISIMFSSNLWAAGTKTDILYAKGFGSYTSNSFSASGTDRSAVANSTNATNVSYALQVFNGSTGQVRGNQSSAANNFNCRNTTTYSNYYISKVTLTVSGGTLDGSSNGRSIVYFGSSAFSLSNIPSTGAVSSKENATGQTTLTWENSNSNVSYFLLYNVKTSGTALSTSATTALTVEWTEKSTPGSTKTTVSYDANGKTLSSSSAALPTDANQYAKEADITISTTQLSADDYDFVGWNTDKNATEAQTGTVKATGSAMTFYAIWKIKTYDVEWYVNGNLWGEKVSYNHGASLALPATTPTSSNCDGVKQFVGWTATADYSNATTAPSDLFTSASGTVTEAKKYYAVFANSEVGDYTNNYQKITTTDEFADGDYMVIAKNNSSYYALNSDVYSTYYLTATSVTYSNNAVSNNTNAKLVWTVKKNSSNQVSLKNGSNYLDIVQSGTYYNLKCNSSTEKFFTYSVNASGEWKLTSVSYSSYFVAHVSGNNYKEFTASSSSSSYPIYILKRQRGTKYTNYATECSAEPTVLVSESELTGLGYIETQAVANSEKKTFVVNGANLNANVVVTVSEEDFEVCDTENGTYASSVSIAPTDGVVTNKTVYVRLKEGKTAGDYNGSISITSDKADTKSVTLAGSVVAKVLNSITINTNPSNLVYTLGEAFNPAGLKINAIYNSGSEIKTYGEDEGFTFTDGALTALTGSMGTIQVTYGEKSAEISLTLNCSVTWSVNGQTLTGDDLGSASASVPHNTKVTSLPAKEITKSDCDGSKVFVGWTATTIIGETDDKPADLFTEATSAQNLTENTTYYAVFAAASAGGAEPTAYTAGATGNYVLAVYNDSKWYALPTNPTVSSGKITGKEITVNTTSASVNYVTTANADGYTWTIANATNGQTISDGTKYIYHSNGGTSGTNLAYGISTDYTWKIESETNGLTFKGMSGSTVNSRGMLANGTSFGGYALSNEDASGYNRIQVLPIAQGTTYTGYATTCCESLPAPENLAVASITKNSASVTWSNVEHATGYEYTINGGANWTAATSPLALIDLAVGTAYTVSVRATDNTGTYCAAGAAANATFTTNYTIAIAEGIANGSIAAATEAAAGDEVTVTVNPNDHYGLYQFTINGEVTPLVEGKFTMPAENVTLGAIFRNDNQHTITFMKNDEKATGEMAVLDFEYPNAVTLTANAFELAAATFKGWATSETGEVVYENGATVSNFSNENQVLYAVWDIAYDHYYDRVHENEFDAQTGVYTRPNLENAATPAADATDCAETHYIFKGWVEEEHAAPTDADLIAGGVTGVTASGKNYYAVWAEKKNVPTKKTISYGWEDGDVKTNIWSTSLKGSIWANARSGEKVASPGDGETIATYSSYAKPISMSVWIRKTSGNTTNSFAFEYKSSPSATWSQVETKGAGNFSDAEWREFKVNLTDSKFANCYFQFKKSGNADIRIDDITFVYETTELSDVDYITECTTRYELTFDNNEGKGLAYEAVRLKKDGTIALPDGSQLSKNMCDFTGWNTSATGDGTHYDANATYTMGEENVTLYAEWKPWTLESLTLTTTDVKTTFYEGDKFTTENLVVKGNYRDVASASHQVEVAGWTTDYDTYREVAFGSNVEAGEHDVTVSYGGESSTYKIEIVKFALPYAYNGDGVNDVPSWFTTTPSTSEKYNTEHTKIAFRSAGTSLILEYPGGAAELTFHAMLNGSWVDANKFVVSTSEDGENWTEVHTFTGSANKLTGSDNDEFAFRISKDAKYIKWEYVTKSSGNVGLGDIHLYEFSYEQAKPLDIAGKTALANYATFSDLEHACFFPAKGITVNTITVTDGVMNITPLETETRILNGQADEVTGYLVPAETGVLVRSDNASIETADYYTVDGETRDAIGGLDNYLRPGHGKDQSNVSIYNTDGNYLYYRLTYNNVQDKTALGFYWGAENGTGDFTVRTGAAYLVVPQDAGIQVRYLFDVINPLPTDVQDIKDVEATKVIINGKFFVIRGARMFDLSGRLVK